MVTKDAQIPNCAPAIHSLIGTAALAQLAQQAFDLNASAPLRLIQSGLNDHYALPTTQGDFILRVYRHAWRSNADVQWELGLVNHLAQGGAPVAAVIPCTDGRWYGVCHGDMSGGNSTYLAGQVIHFDLDCAGPGWRPYDLGVFFWSLSINGHGEDVWAPFLQGYRAQHAIDEAELVLVPAFAAIRVIWLMGLWCANADRFGYHTLHADYFERELARFQSLFEKAMRALGEG